MLICLVKIMHSQFMPDAFSFLAIAVRLVYGLIFESLSKDESDMVENSCEQKKERERQGKQ